VKDRKAGEKGYLHKQWGLKLSGGRGRIKKIFSILNSSILGEKAWSLPASLGSTGGGPKKKVRETEKGKKKKRLGIPY